MVKKVPWSRVSPVLERCLELPPAELDAYLAGACGAETAAWVRRLLAAEARTSVRRFLERPERPERSLAGQRVGSWRLIEPIGEGGMGIVWLGERADGAFEKRVAVKLLKLGLHVPELEQRFQNEVRVLATLEHASIVRLLDGGHSEENVPFLVLEHVAGEPIDAWCDAHRLNLRARIELFLQVCAAVQHAHEHGVLHRDLKPTNVLVDRDGRARLLDFGIAKIVGDIDGGDTVGATRTGQRLYSPRYASPEQVRGDATSATSDVYSLGVMLYELLVGRPPYRVSGFSQFELERAACDTDPDRPSRAEAWTGAPQDGEPTEPGEPAWSARGFRAPRELSRALAGDIDWILLTALRKEPERRYATVTELKDDLCRHLERRPVLARPESRAYRARRFVQRHRGIVALAGVLGFALTVGLVVALVLYSDARNARREIERVAYASALRAAAASLESGAIGAARAQLEAQPEFLRGWEWRHLASRLDRTLAMYPEAGVEEGLDALAVSPDGAWAVTTQYDALTWIDLTGARASYRSDLEGRSWHVRGLRARFDGQELALACTDGRVRFVRPWSADILRTYDVSETELLALAYDPRGDVLVWTDYAGWLGVLDPQTGEERTRFRAHERGQFTVRFAPDGRRLATGSWDKTAKIWDAETWELLHELTGHERWVTQVAWSLDGNTLVTASLDETVRSWDARTGRATGVFRPHAGAVYDLQVFASGEVLSAGFGGEILRWELATGRRTARFLGHAEAVYAARIDETNGRVVSAAPDGARIFDLATQDVVAQPASVYSTTVAVQPDGDGVANCGPDGRVRIFDSRGEARAVVRMPPSTRSGIGQLLEIGWVGTGLIAASQKRDVLALSDPTTGAPLAFVPGIQRLNELVVLEPADRIALIGLPCTVLDLESGEITPLARPGPDGAGSGVLGKSAALRPGGGELAISTGAEVLRFDLARSSLRDVLRPEGGIPEAVQDLAYDPVGRRLFLVCGDALWEWDLSESPARQRRRELEFTGSALAFHPAGSRLALGSASGEIHVLDAEHLDEVVVLRGHGGFVADLAFTPDGRTLVSCGREGTVRFWTSE